jgi:hypothetical protein
MIHSPLRSPVKIVQYPAQVLQSFFIFLPFLLPVAAILRAEETQAL